MGRMRCVRREMPVSGLWAALVFLIALNLRPAIAAVGPLLADRETSGFLVME